MIVYTVESVYSNILRERGKYVTICEVDYIRTLYKETFKNLYSGAHYVSLLAYEILKSGLNPFSRYSKQRDIMQRINGLCVHPALVYQKFKMEVE